jgi:drug/metabolite transporter (DMT)-like permease
VINEAPNLYDVSLNSDDENDIDDIDTVVQAYRRGMRRQQRRRLVQWRATAVGCLLLIGSCLSLGGIASWLAVHADAMPTIATLPAFWPLIGPLVGLFLLLIGWLLCRRDANRPADQLIAVVTTLSALLLLGFYLAHFLMAKSGSGTVYSLAVSAWLGLGLVIYHKNMLSCCRDVSEESERHLEQANVKTVATIS